MKYRIVGDAMQTVAVELSEGEAVLCRGESVLFVRGAVRAEDISLSPQWTALNLALGEGKRGRIIALKCEKGGGLVGLSARGAGRVYPAQLEGTIRLIGRCDAFLAVTGGVTADPLRLEDEEAERIPKGIFASFHGSGWVFMHGLGSLVEFSLSAGEEMIVDGEMIVVLDSETGYIPRPLKGVGFKEGSFVMELRGPGRVVLQTVKP